MTDADYKKYKRLIKKIILVKENSDCCNRCKEKFNYDHYDFHHINPEEKDYNISQMIHRDLDELRKETSKCVVLCKECHRITHLEMSRDEEKKHMEENLSKLIDSNLEDYINSKGQVKFTKLMKEADNV